MRILKLAGLVLLGVFAGLLASGSLLAAAHQVPGGRNLTAIPVSNSTCCAASFIRDSKTGACWLMIRARDDQNAALAPAPRESCEQ